MQQKIELKKDNSDSSKKKKGFSLFKAPPAPPPSPNVDKIVNASSSSKSDLIKLNNDLKNEMKELTSALISCKVDHAIALMDLDVEKNKVAELSHRISALEKELDSANLELSRYRNSVTGKLFFRNKTHQT